MADPIISFITENDVAFRQAIEKAGNKISDFRIPFDLIGAHFYKGNRKLFTLKSEGLYPVLGGFSPKQKVQFRGRGNFSTKQEKAEVLKSEEVGFIYPLLKRRGRLEKSLSGKNASEAEYFAGRQTLVMGTNVPYAKFHQSDRARTKLPQRKMVFIDGGPAEKAKDALINGRRQTWIKIIEDYVSQVLKGQVK